MKKRVTYDYQEDGISTIVNAFEKGFYRDKRGQFAAVRSFLLYDEMGLGKTWQAIQALSRLTLTDPILVVCPTTCIEMWEKELKTVFSDIRIFKPSSGSQFLSKCTSKTVVIVNYECLRNQFKYFMDNQREQLSNDELIRFCHVYGVSTDQTLALSGNSLRIQLLKLARNCNYKSIKSNKIDAKIVSQQWGAIVMDEVHKIKNPDSLGSKAVGFLNGRYRIALSGTPVMNHGGDLMSIWKYGLGLFDLDWPSIQKNPNGEYCKQIQEAVSLGRRKEDIQELAHVLPKRQKEDEHIFIEWKDAEHRMIYQTVKRESIHLYHSLMTETEAAKRKDIRLSFLAKFQQLRQICLHKDLPKYMIDNQYRRKQVFTFLLCLRRLTGTAFTNNLRARLIQEIDQIEPSLKMQVIHDWILRKERLIIFSTYKIFLKYIMQPWLTQIGIDSLVFSGDESRKEQGDVIRLFEKDQSIRVLLIVKSCGGEGLNLQGTCSTCFIMDPHFNDAADEQAAQRIDRIGQTNDHVTIRKLFMEGSVDKALLNMQERKTETNVGWTMGKKPKTLQVHGLFLDKHDTV